MADPHRPYVSPLLIDGARLTWNFAIQSNSCSPSLSLL
jgi:hypothetical protein